MFMVRAALVSAALGLAACNTVETATAPAPEPVRPAAKVATLDIPAGEPCGAELATYKSVIDNDLHTGHVNKSVYDRIVAELRPAVAACQAARNYEALALMNAAKRRYGYPVSYNAEPARRFDVANRT